MTDVGSDARALAMVVAIIVAAVVLALVCVGCGAVLLRGAVGVVYDPAPEAPTFPRTPGPGVTHGP